MSKESLHIYDSLDERVREALRNALGPYDAKYFVDISVPEAIAMIEKWDRYQHHFSTMAGVVAPIGAQSFRLTPKRRKHK